MGLMREIGEGINLQRIMLDHGDEYNRYRESRQMEGEVPLDAIRWYTEIKAAAGDDEPIDSEDPDVLDQEIDKYDKKMGRRRRRGQRRSIMD